MKRLLNSRQNGNKKTYKNGTYNITLKYNKDWKLNPAYTDRYEGKDGFFQVTALTGDSMSIDEIAKNEVEHILNPYGSNPKITNLKIQGQEARLIMPSNDQPKENNNQAELIIQYPKKIIIDGTYYYYFVLFADKNNIHDIAKTINFIH